jgi:hypothetical protein
VAILRSKGEHRQAQRRLSPSLKEAYKARQAHLAAASRDIARGATADLLREVLEAGPRLALLLLLSVNTCLAALGCTKLLTGCWQRSSAASTPAPAKDVLLERLLRDETAPVLCRAMLDAGHNCLFVLEIACVFC